MTQSDAKAEGIRFTLGPIAAQMVLLEADGEKPNKKHLERVLTSHRVEPARITAVDYSPLLDELIASMLHLRYMVLATAAPDNDEMIAVLERGNQRAENRLTKAIEKSKLPMKKTHEALTHHHARQEQLTAPETGKERDHEPEAER
jgi:hypothetical protein